MPTAGSYNSIPNHPETLGDSRPGILSGQAAEQNLLVHVNPQLLLIRYFSGMNQESLSTFSEAQFCSTGRLEATDLAQSLGDSSPELDQGEEGDRRPCKFGHGI